MNAGFRASSKKASKNRLGVALALALLVHLILLSISFDWHKPGQLSKSLEVTLATFKAEAPVKQADFIAQHDQAGSGALEHKAVPTTTEKALLQDTQVNHVTPPAAPPKAQPKPDTTQVVSTRAPAPSKAPPPVERPAPKPVKEALHFDREQLSAEIASLEADVALEKQLYAKRPKIHRINAASTMRDRGAWYKDDWRRKVERVGNQNYPAEARRQQIYGSLRLLVTIRRDGSLQEVQILESSGHAVLDQAALRIVRLAAPFAPLTGDLAGFDQLEIVRTWRFERGDRLFSH